MLNFRLRCIWAHQAQGSSSGCDDDRAPIDLLLDAPYPSAGAESSPAGHDSQRVGTEPAGPTLMLQTLGSDRSSGTDPVFTRHPARREIQE
jgi:hypothetical protein